MLIVIYYKIKYINSLHNVEQHSRKKSTSKENPSCLMYSKID